MRGQRSLAWPLPQGPPYGPLPCVTSAILSPPEGFLPVLALTPTSVLLLDRQQSCQDTKSLSRLLRARGSERPAWDLPNPRSVLLPSCSGFLVHAILHIWQVLGSLCWGSHTTQAPQPGPCFYEDNKKTILPHLFIPDHSKS